MGFKGFVMGLGARVLVLVQGMFRVLVLVFAYGTMQQGNTETRHRNVWPRQISTGGTNSVVSAAATVIQPHRRVTRAEPSTLAHPTPPLLPPPHSPSFCGARIDLPSKPVLAALRMRLISALIAETGAAWQ